MGKDVYLELKNVRILKCVLLRKIAVPETFPPIPNVLLKSIIKFVIILNFDDKNVRSFQEILER